MMPLLTELQFCSRLIYKYSAPDGAEGSRTLKRNGVTGGSGGQESGRSMIMQLFVRVRNANAKNLVARRGSLVAEPPCNSEPRQGRHICRTRIREDPRAPLGAISAYRTPTMNHDAAPDGAPISLVGRFYNYSAPDGAGGSGMF